MNENFFLSQKPSQNQTFFLSQNRPKIQHFFPKMVQNRPKSNTFHLKNHQNQKNFGERGSSWPYQATKKTKKYLGTLSIQIEFHEYDKGTLKKHFPPHFRRNRNQNIKILCQKIDRQCKGSNMM